MKYEYEDHRLEWIMMEINSLSFEDPDLRDSGGVALRKAIEYMRGLGNKPSCVNNLVRIQDGLYNDYRRQRLKNRASKSSIREHWNEFLKEFKYEMNNCTHTLLSTDKGDQSQT